MIHLTDAQIDELINIDDAIPALERGFRGLASGDAAVQRRVRTEAGGVKLSTLGAVVPELGVAGAKVYSTLSGQFNFSIVLFSTVDGSLLATLEANSITRLRTAATTVVAVRALARKQATTAAIFGTGVQGRAHALALATHTDLRSFRIVGLEGTQELAAEVNAVGASRGVKSVVADPADAVPGADVVVTATRATGALFDGTTVTEGTLVAAIGSSLPHTRELDDALIARASRIVVELRDQAREEAGDLVLAKPGTFNWADTVELGDVLAGRAKGRVRDDDVIVYKAVGIGLQDIVLAGIAWEKHVSRNTVRLRGALQGPQ
ncbi:ornithine cyclodeaminase family protein [Paraburkholderia silvatlantica]|uniref:Ornithine cyclodeaminase n=1 Tax=Paraburkholderia silvatlantica TaxID=321895 RepID=A0A2U1ABK1_9BURK|nr:ornithine cyclodeaminase family protein [Paraburkholderia silvatlantica]MBB2930321.1 ornithine cyclodeaminase [Paraburkholderia silvatlantica]PVY32151.1 ornithine cyclodeaminase [Paraburkholderia silvatlantica]PXW37771.1 ornithine cyclodeaminase [Paraburkholderia silvatlantica]PYE25592.1 ornithine cyclodeaminase [Paraburkholderia silvatlantica]TDQ97765.1 ornithine cyclodeaminase [Paraburkholderia silvatlantica]